MAYPRRYPVGWSVYSLFLEWFQWFRYLRLHHLCGHEYVLYVGKCSLRRIELFTDP